MEQQQPQKPLPVKIKLDKYLKNFLFFTLKGRKDYKEMKKKIGDIKSMNIIINYGKAILRAKSATQKVDEPFTDEELQKFCKLVKIKQQTIDDSKSIFIMMDMVAKNIYIQQNKKDGTTKEFTI